MSKRRKKGGKKALIEFIGLLHNFPRYKVAFGIRISTTLGLLCSSHHSASSAHFIVCQTELVYSGPLLVAL